MDVFSFVIFSDFSSFRKFDTSSYYLTSYFIPRPTILGIMGGIIGLAKSTKEKLAWWEEVKDVKVSLEPLNLNPTKCLVTYNNSTGAASYDDSKIGQNLIVHEQILISPKYRIYVELTEKTSKMLEYLQNKKTVFTPYLGKNEFKADICDVQKHIAREFEGKAKINSIYPSIASNLSYKSSWITEPNQDVFILETYPFDYTEDYKYISFPFVYSNREIDTKIFDSKNKIDGKFLQLDNGKKIFLYGGTKK